MLLYLQNDLKNENNLFFVSVATWDDISAPTTPWVLAHLLLAHHTHTHTKVPGVSASQGVPLPSLIQCGTILTHTRPRTFFQFVTASQQSRKLRSRPFDQPGELNYSSFLIRILFITTPYSLRLSSSFIFCLEWGRKLEEANFKPLNRGLEKRSEFGNFVLESLSFWKGGGEIWDFSPGGGGAKIKGTKIKHKRERKLEADENWRE